MGYQDDWEAVYKTPGYQQLLIKYRRKADDLARFFAREVVAKEDRNAVGPFLRGNLSKTAGTNGEHDVTVTMTDGRFGTKQVKADAEAIAADEIGTEHLKGNLTGQILTGANRPTTEEVGEGVRKFVTEDYPSAVSDVVHGRVNPSNVAGIKAVAGDFADPVSVLLGGVVGKGVSVVGSKAVSKLKLKANAVAAESAKAAKNARGRTPEGVGYVDDVKQAQALDRMQAARAAADSPTGLVARAGQAVDVAALTAGGVAPVAGMAAVQGRMPALEEGLLGVVGAATGLRRGNVTKSSAPALNLAAKRPPTSVAESIGIEPGIQSNGLGQDFAKWTADQPPVEPTINPASVWEPPAFGGKTVSDPTPATYEHPTLKMKRAMGTDVAARSGVDTIYNQMDQMWQDHQPTLEQAYRDVEGGPNAKNRYYRDKANEVETTTAKVDDITDRYYRARADNLEAETGLADAKGKYYSEKVGEVEAATAKVDDVTDRYNRDKVNEVERLDEANTYLDEQETLNKKYGGDMRLGAFGGVPEGAFGRVADDIANGVSNAMAKVPDQLRHVVGVLSDFSQRFQDHPAYTHVAALQNFLESGIVNTRSKIRQHEVMQAIKAFATKVKNQFGPDHPLTGIVHSLGRIFGNRYGMPQRLNDHLRYGADAATEKKLSGPGSVHEALATVERDNQVGILSEGDLDYIGKQFDPRRKIDVTSEQYQRTKPYVDQLKAAIDTRQGDMVDAGALSEYAHLEHRFKYMTRIFDHAKGGSGKPLGGMFKAAKHVFSGYHRRGRKETMSRQEFEHLKDDAWEVVPDGVGTYTATNPRTGAIEMGISKEQAGRYSEPLTFEGYSGPHANEIAKLEDRVIPDLEAQLAIAHASDPAKVDQRQAALEDAHTRLEDLRDKAGYVSHRDHSIRELDEDMNVIHNILKSGVEYDRVSSKNIRSASVLQFIADPANGWAQEVPKGGETVKEGFTYLGNERAAKGSSVKKWGPLAGHLVSNDVYPFLWWRQMEMKVQEFNNRVGTTLAKRAVTQLSPAYYRNIVLSNTAKFYTSGGDPFDIFPTIEQFANGTGKEYTHAIEKGIIRGGREQRELAQRIKRNYETEGPSELMSSMFSSMADLSYEAGKAGSVMDDVYRVALYRSLTRKGMDSEAAGRIAKTAFYSGDSVSSPFTTIASTWSMFPKLPQYALNALAEDWESNPLRVMQVAAGLPAAAFLSAKAAGIDGDTLEKVIPAWLKGYGKKIVLPWRDGNDHLQVVPTGAADPYGPLELSKVTRIPAPQSWEVNTPIARAIAWGAGYSTKAGQRFTDEEPSSIAGQFIPPPVKHAYRAVAGEPGKHPRQLTGLQQVLRGTGVANIVPVDEAAELYRYNKRHKGDK